MATVHHLHDEPQPMPASLEAEQMLIGAVLVSNAAYDAASPVVTAEEFFDELHQIIWRAIGQQIERGREASPVTLKPYLPDREGAHAYLDQLHTSGFVTTVNAPDYARIVHEAYLAREIIGACGNVRDELHERYDGDELERHAKYLQDILDRARESATERKPVLGMADAARGALDASRTIQDARESGQGVAIVSTGIQALDRVIGGFFPGELIIAAGATGMGKSAFAQGVAEYASLGGDITFHSLEMSAAQLAQRAISARSGVPVWAIRRGSMHPDQWERVQQATAELDALPVHIDDNGATSIADIRRGAKTIARKGNLRLIVVDYIQLLMSDGRTDNRAYEIARITRSLKQIAREMDVPVLALSQLSREVDRRDDKRPQLSDLRESGSIEQDADVVIFCYRPGYYEERKKPQRINCNGEAEYRQKLGAWEADVKELDNAAELLVAKQRQGEANKSARVRFNRESVRFTDLTTEDYQGGMDF